MNDISDMISQLLSDPDAQQKLAQAAAQLGLGADETPPAAEPRRHEQPQMPDIGMLSSLIGSDGPGRMMPMIAKLLPLLSGERRETDSTRLLCALEPFLSGERKRKLADVRRLMGVLDMVERINE